MTRYKPRVIIGSYTIKWFPAKYRNLMLSKNKKEVEFAMKSINVSHFDNESILLNKKGDFVNAKLKESHLIRLFKRYGLKYSNENIYLLRNLKIKSETKANYYV